jgi:hypothetical protein
MPPIPRFSLYKTDDKLIMQEKVIKGEQGRRKKNHHNKQQMMI